MVEENEEVKAGAPDWVVTFADLMSLLMTFFVLLLSFSNTEIVKFRAVAHSMRNALGLKTGLGLNDQTKGNSLLEFMKPQSGDGPATSQQIVADLEQILAAAGMEKDGTAKVTKRGVVLQLSGDLLFVSGEATISKRALPLLDGLAEYVRKLDRSVDIAGHTDNIPIANQIYPSNWELSAARAGQAVRYMADKGVGAEKMRAIGHADSIPVASNDTAKGRAANRRVEFVFVSQSAESEARREGESAELEDYATEQGDSQ